MDVLERVAEPDGHRRVAVEVHPAEGGACITAQAYLQRAERFLPADARLGPLPEYTPAHAALYRPRAPAAEGGCTCGHVRYRLLAKPLVVHCCHCRWCQRETGTAFALNAMIEMHRVQLLAGRPERVDTPSLSGRGQKILRCPHCRIALWSHYAGAGESVAFVRVGTLDDPDGFPPDIHIFTASKQPWVVIPPGHRAVPEYYSASEVWSAEALQRREQLRRA